MSENENARTPITPSLEIKGPDGESIHVQITKDRVTIGRIDHQNDVVLYPDPQKLVSRTHCYLERIGGWWIVDNGSVNGVFVRQKDQVLQQVQGRARLEDGQVICLLGRFFDQGQKYWEITFLDPSATNPAAIEEFMPDPDFLEYDWAKATLSRTSAGQRVVLALSPQEQSLIRYMVQRNKNNNNVAVVCSAEELITAVWGAERSNWGEDDGDLSKTALTTLVYQLRRKIEPEPKTPKFLRIVKGVGYSLTIKLSSFTVTSVQEPNIPTTFPTDYQGVAVCCAVEVHEFYGEMMPLQLPAMNKSIIKLAKIVGEILDSSATIMGQAEIDPS
jgi:DNA-binding winged helix-turn-helix (wHTH) protein